jgi:glycosyltransferase involved in cell wall biosynthesis
MRVYHKKMDGLITISKYLSNYYNDHPNVIELPPLVDKNATKWKISKSDYSNKNIINLVFVGTPGNGQKDRLDYIIKSLSKAKSEVRQFELIIVGITMQQYQNIYGINSIPSNVINQISFLGNKAHIQAIDYIKKSDFSIFLRNRNLVNTAGFPTKFVESISCGTPVITNSTSNIKDYIEDENIGVILDDTKEESLVKSLINSLCLNENEIKKMKDNCLFSKSFDYNNYIEIFHNFINKL